LPLSVLGRIGVLQGELTGDGNQRSYQNDSGAGSPTPHPTRSPVVSQICESVTAGLQT
jgi:hypothetical protein